MSKVKMSGQLKELLKLQGVSDDTVGIVEDYYNNIIHGVTEEFQNAQPKEEPIKPLSIQEMAENARIIK